MEKMESMEIFNFDELGIKVKFPIINVKRFRVKNKIDDNNLGQTYAPSKNKYTDRIYFEWQISYGNKDDLQELSVIFKTMKDNLIISNDDIEELISFANSTNYYLDNYDINIMQTDNQLTNINMNICYRKLNIPYFIYENSDSSYIEIYKRNKQVASGMMLMLYFNIPITIIENKDLLLDKKASDIKNDKYAIYTFSKETVFNLFKCFIIMSEKHKNDVIEILDNIRC